ncbi:uncharacterized protein I303_104819 [Kwoniella dejecticola CBS 10117]|uniref:Alpha-1,2-mannosidase n=1 Tax=Kwoniella dejecticola CBS 10117 TaxID=1296121 RepID=A0A1A6A4A6_9TREE|nr:uncharacterized protein I303_04200 [Kwoniella dejecticola CBS 10117]OBR84878.1 hypothetical protein I303_04200 [Kwoniella dejecticola CBS 10117]
MTDLRRRQAPPPLEQPISPIPQFAGAQRRTLSKSWRPPKTIVLLLLALGVTGVYVYLSSILENIPFFASRLTSGSQNHQGFKKIRPHDESTSLPEGLVYGHADFQDGRSRTCRLEFAQPESEGCAWVNVNLGNGGPEPNLSGGMIPAVAPPFGMTRWTPQTRENYVSMCPYNQTDSKIHGLIGTHQPAIWMGESGSVEIHASLGRVITDFQKRGLPFKRKDEYASANYYRNLLDAGQDGKVEIEMSASSRVGHIRYTFHPTSATAKVNPHVVLQASRKTWILHGDQPDDKVPYLPKGHIEIDIGNQEVRGWNDERQDHVLVGDELPAKGFKSYFVAQFSQPFTHGAISHSGMIEPDVLKGDGEVLAGYVQFEEGTPEVEVRVGVSFISFEQASRNIDLEIPQGQTLARTSQRTRSEWAEKLDLLSVEGATPSNLTVLYTSFAHTLVYPYEISEPTPNGPAYYSGYLDKVVPGTSYSGYSIWDTFRAQSAWLILVAPERVGAMIQSMMQDYREGGWLPMWKNIVETNIMVGSHADSMIAQAMKIGVQGFDYDEAWQAVRKNAFTPPDRDTELRFGDREEGTPQEVRAGLTEYMKLGYVADDLHTESGSRTLNYAYDDHATSIVASLVGAEEVAKVLRERAKNYRYLYNSKTGHMEARNSDRSWAGSEKGWTEGDHWAYTLDVMHDVPGLIDLMGGKDKLVEFLDKHFEGGHNLHTNEPSHHIPYIYILAGQPHKTQEWVRRIGESDYNHTADGLSGNEDCGQMSAWYLFSAMGLYPVDPANATYVLGAPFFDTLTLRLPDSGKRIEVLAKGASSNLRFVKNLRVNGRDQKDVVVDHNLLSGGGRWEWEMKGDHQVWGM